MIYKHIKTGRLYRLVAEAKQEKDLEDVVVYQHIEGGIVWVRNAKEFWDGRFKAVSNKEMETKND